LDKPIKIEKVIKKTPAKYNRPNSSSKVTVARRSIEAKTQHNSNLTVVNSGRRSPNVNFVDRSPYKEMKKKKSNSSIIATKYDPTPAM
jgi:hypothetical protein